MFEIQLFAIECNFLFSEEGLHHYIIFMFGKGQGCYKKGGWRNGGVIKPKHL